MLNPGCVSCHQSDWMWRCLRFSLNVIVESIHPHVHSVCSLILIQCPLKFPCHGYKAVHYKSFGTKYTGEKSDTLLKFIAHRLQNRGCISACHEIYFHSFHVSLNLFKRISEGKCTCWRAGCLGFLQSQRDWWMLYSLCHYLKSHHLGHPASLCTEQQ